MREGSKGYAPILGGIGSFVVTAVTVVFTVQPRGADPALLAYTIGLLVVGLIGCLTGAFVFAAIGAERQLTPNLPAAALYAGASSAVGVVAILAAFEGLAALYLPEAKSLFAMITVGMEVGAVVLVALVLGDAWVAPADPGSLSSGQHWLGTRQDAYSAGLKAAVATALAVLVGGVLHFVNVRIALGSAGVHIFIGAGIVLTVGGALLGMFRTTHTPGIHRVGIHRMEAIIVLSGLAAYLIVLMLCLP